MPKISKTDLKNNDYLSNGVTMSPAIPSAGEKVKILYDGLLSKNGASHAFAHVGFGTKWDNIYDYQMVRTSTGFEANIPVAASDVMNVCFKDCADNWDNNSGKNYSFDVS